jgi:hypothetical protein
MRNITTIVDYLKLHRETIANRLKAIDKEHRQELESNGFSVWEVIYKLERACEYVKRQATITNKPELYWKATLDFIDQCQKLGVIHEKPQEIDVLTFPVHSEEDERIIIRHYQEEHKRTLQAIKAAEDNNTSEGVELIQEIKED